MTERVRYTELRPEGFRERLAAAPIVAARTVDQLAENAGTVDVALTARQRERIADAY